MLYDTRDSPRVYMRVLTAPSLQLEAVVVVGLLSYYKPHLIS